MIPFIPSLTEINAELELAPDVDEDGTEVRPGLTAPPYSRARLSAMCSSSRSSPSSRSRPVSCSTRDRR